MYYRRYVSIVVQMLEIVFKITVFFNYDFRIEAANAR